MYYKMTIEIKMFFSILKNLDNELILFFLLKITYLKLQQKYINNIS